MRIVSLNSSRAKLASRDMEANQSHSARASREVMVPASTSNLGPGFDFLGLALSLFVRVRATPDRSSTHHTFGLREGAAVDWPTSAENLFLRAFEHACARLSSPVEPMRFDVYSEIPVARGFGSSGAAV